MARDIYERMKSSYGESKNYNYHVEFGSIYNATNTWFMDNVGIIFDKELGTILKVGDVDRDKMKDKLMVMQQAYRTSGFDEEANTISLLEFDKYTGVLSQEEICVILNWLTQCSATNWMDYFFSEDVNVLKDKIKSLKELGY